MHHGGQFRTWGLGLRARAYVDVRDKNSTQPHGTDYNL